MVFLLLFRSSLVIGQAEDHLRYYVILNNDSTFSCTIPYKIEGKIIKAIKEDRSEHLILWKEIRSISIFGSDGKMRDIKQMSKKELNELRREETQKMQHGRWDSCFIVKFGGDTLWGRFRTTDNYTLSSEKAFFMADFMNEDRVRFAYGDGKEESISSYDIRELHVIGESKQQYITLQGMLFSVVVDGKCQLLQGGAKKLYSSAGGMGSTASAVATDTYQPYYVYYKGELTEINTQITIWNPEANFRELCSKLFEECPTVVGKLAKKEYGPYSLRRMVTEFNECLNQ